MPTYYNATRSGLAVSLVKGQSRLVPAKSAFTVTDAEVSQELLAMVHKGLLSEIGTKAPAPAPAPVPAPVAAPAPPVRPVAAPVSAPVAAAPVVSPAPEAAAPKATEGEVTHPETPESKTDNKGKKRRF